MQVDAMAIVAGLVTQITKAWNDADGDAYARAFTDDASFVDIRGGFHRGRPAIGRGHQALFDTIYRGSRLTSSVLMVHDRGDTILAQAHLRLQAPNAPLPPNDGAVATLVIGRDGGEWRIASFLNTLRPGLAGGGDQTKTSRMTGRPIGDLVPSVSDE